jgi:adenylate cyclase
VLVAVVPAAGTFTESIAVLVLCLAIVAVQAAILRALSRQVDIGPYGLLGAGTDALALCALPVMWHLVYSGDTEPLIHLTRHNFTAASFVFVVMNGLALRPLYPLLLTTTVTIVHIVLGWLAVNDPRVDHTLPKVFGVGATVVPP